MKSVKEQNPIFDFYFDRAIAEWPEEVDVGKINLYDQEGGRYSTLELYDLSERLSHAYLNKSDEVMMRNMHDSIYFTIHKAAKFVTHIKPRFLRRSTVADIFEVRIKDALPEHGWTADDFQLIKDYFAASGNKGVES